MKLPQFIENIFYVKPFCMQTKNICNANQSLFYIYSDDDKNLNIFVIIENQLLEIHRDYSTQQITSEIFDISLKGLKTWKNRKNKILLMKKQADISTEKDLIEKITHQLSFQKKHIKLKSEDTIQIVRNILKFHREYYKNNVIEVNFSMTLGKQNHWLD